ncbi:spindle pole body protein Cut12 [Schizosaccharomyces japonicus yFS275]|uniref:Spindle pole body protein Cut12 n=1 Tax=Schizosaccharomyces japonicus (strain yFS275 / FY16936) TaxID=402676 RepID=B6K266_SCHJY|nr:spindle pole body protein Cut12 [Schizosaccharomyces japonicus yFS275]EEB07247.1 spindle pole body protein Cut12 [Schizosaccharomyces japonicus yFS275]
MLLFIFLPRQIRAFAALRYTVFGGESIHAFLDTPNTPPPFAWAMKALSSKITGTVSRSSQSHDVLGKKGDDSNAILANSTDNWGKDTPNQSKNVQNGILKTPGTAQAKKSVKFRTAENAPVSSWQSLLTRRFQKEHDLSGVDKAFSPRPSRLSQLQEDETKDDDDTFGASITQPLYTKTNEVDNLDGLVEKVTSQETNNADSENAVEPAQSNDWTELLKRSLRDVVNNNRRMSSVLHDMLVDTSQQSIVQPDDAIEDPDYTVNFDSPKSSSGKYWKEKFSTLEIINSKLEKDWNMLNKSVTESIAEKDREVAYWKGKYEELLKRQSSKPAAVDTPVEQLTTKPVPDSTTPSHPTPQPRDMSELAAQMLSHSARKRAMQKNALNLTATDSPRTPSRRTPGLRERLLRATQTPTPIPVTPTVETKEKRSAAAQDEDDVFLGKGVNDGTFRKGSDMLQMPVKESRLEKPITIDTPDSLDHLAAAAKRLEERRRRWKLRKQGL